MIAAWEKEYLRELAKIQLELAEAPENKEKIKLWYAHNRGEVTVPVVVAEMASFSGDLMPAVKCQSPVAKQIEHEFQSNIISQKYIADDKVVPNFLRFSFMPEFHEFSMNIEKTFASSIGFTQKHPIKNLEEDWHKLKPSTWSFDKEDFNQKISAARDAVGDIMEVVPHNYSLTWYPAPSSKVVDLMGMEEMLISLYDYPELMHKLYQFIVDDIKAYISWQEKVGLLTPNNGNTFAGSGSYGFSKELSSASPCTAKGMWGNLNSQETVGVSPDMYFEFMFPYYKQLSELFGLVYYGCCEPVDPIWESSVSKLSGLRKVSISPWCKEEFMGEALRGTNIIYSRKPSPNFVGVGEKLDELGFTEHIEKSLRAARGCAMEIIFRDVYTLGGDKHKAGRAVELVRRAAAKYF